jgi:hypothetical protein
VGINARAFVLHKQRVAICAESHGTVEGRLVSLIARHIDCEARNDLRLVLDGWNAMMHNELGWLVPCSLSEAFASPRPEFAQQ